LPVYLFGSPGLEKILNEAGIETIGVGPDTIDKYTSDGTFLMDIDISRRVFAVVGSFDNHISYAKIMKAVNYLKDPKVHFVVSNEDLTFPGSVPGVIVPGAGIVSCVLKVVLSPLCCSPSSMYYANQNLGHLQKAADRDGKASRSYIRVYSRPARGVV